MGSTWSVNAHIVERMGTLSNTDVAQILLSRCISRPSPLPNNKRIML